MKLILKETIESLGIIGSEVDVAPGYGRNYLLPQGKAVLATPQNRKLLEQQRQEFDFQIAREKQRAEEMAQSLKGVVCRLSAKVSDKDRLYGSIGLRDILTALEQQDIKLDKKMVLLAEPIKTIGTFKVPIRVYRDVEPEITVEVVAE